jgi:hypothetical protein
VRTYSCSSLALLILLFASHPGTVTAQQQPNANSFYRQLRALSPTGDAIAVRNLVLQRGGAILTFQTGSIQFYPAVNGKVTGAVFLGRGHFHLTPPTPEERHNLKILTHSDTFDEDFDQAVLRFTDPEPPHLRPSADHSQPSRICPRLSQITPSRLWADHQAALS